MNTKPYFEKCAGSSSRHALGENRDGHLIVLAPPTPRKKKSGEVLWVLSRPHPPRKPHATDARDSVLRDPLDALSQLRAGLGTEPDLSEDKPGVKRWLRRPNEIDPIPLSGKRLGNYRRHDAPVLEHRPPGEVLGEEHRIKLPARVKCWGCGDASIVKPR